MAKKDGAKVCERQNFMVKRLKREIDALILRLSGEAARENVALKREILALRAENRRLYRELAEKPDKTAGYFGQAEGIERLRFTER